MGYVELIICELNRYTFQEYLGFDLQVSNLVQDRPW